MTSSNLLVKHDFFLPSSSETPACNEEKITLDLMGKWNYSNSSVVSYQICTMSKMFLFDCYKVMLHIN